MCKYLDSNGQIYNLFIHAIFSCIAPPFFHSFISPLYHVERGSPLQCDNMGARSLLIETVRTRGGLSLIPPVCVQYGICTQFLFLSFFFVVVVVNRKGEINDIR